MKVNILDIAIVQADILWENVSENISRISNLLSKINSIPHIVLLPEMFTSGFSLNADALAESPDGRTTQWMLDTSKASGFAIGGSIIIREGGAFYNRFLFVTPQGAIYKYDKRHLFTYANEHLTYTRGNTRLVFEYLGWRILPQICYDLRFPVWSRNRNDYDLLINVANFPANRREIWTTLLKARAIENQCYVAAVNRVGTDGLNINYSGDSMIVNSVGASIVETFPGEERILQAKISLDELNTIRDKFPVLGDADTFTI